MATLAIAPLLVLLDSIAAGVALFSAALGTSAADPDSVSEGAANNITTLVDAMAEDGDLEAGDLLAEFQRRAPLVTATALYRALQGERLMAALDAHYGGTASLNGTLRTAGQRVHPDLRLIGIQVDAENAFPPVVVTLGTFAVTGAATGTFTAGSQVDTSLYAKANCLVRTTSAIGSTTTVTLTMVKRDGTTEQRIVTLPSGTAADVSFDIGTHGADLYIGCSAVAVSGATAGNTFSIRTEVERSVVL